MRVHKTLYLILISSLLFFFYSCQKQPEALFSYEPSNLEIDVPVYFSNHSIDAESYEWDFGDGTTSTEKNPYHVYSSKGIYIITLTAYSDNGKKDDEMSAFASVSVFFKSPGLMSVFNVDDYHTISWDEEISGNNSVSLYLLEDGALVQPIYLDINDNSYRWKVPGTLSNGTTYQIKGIVNSSPEKEYFSDYFTIYSDKYITVTYPDSGTVITANANLEILWESNLGYNDDVCVALLKADTLFRSISSETSDDGKYSWNAYVGISGSDYRIFISSVVNPEISDLSQQFTIEGSSIAITEPVSSTIWTSGTSDVITWTSNMTYSDYVKIELYKGDIFMSLLDESEANDGAFYGGLPFGLVTDTDYQIKVTSVDYHDIYDYSDPFTVEYPYINLTQPSSVAIWPAGASRNILWNTNLTTDKYVQIGLYKGGSFLSTISDNAYNNGSFSYVIPVDALIGSDYHIFIASNDYLNIYDNSEQFAVELPYISITEPTSATSWAAGSYNNVLWISNLSSSIKVKIELYKGGALHSIIDNNEDNDGTFFVAFQANIVPATDYQIKITTENNSDVFDFSDEFTIVEPYIYLTEPISSTTWIVGEDHNIFWESNMGYYDDVKLELYKSDLYIYSIDSYEYNDGVFIWNVATGLLTGNDYQVKISYFNITDVYDFSDYFTITN